MGDAGFLLGLFTIAWYFGTIQYTQVNAIARSGKFLIGDPLDYGSVFAPVCRGVRQVGAVPVVCLAAGRDGRPDAGVGIDPRGHHGDRGRLHGGAIERAIRTGTARR